MPDRVTLLTGIAGSGKTAECLLRYRDALRPQPDGTPPGHVLWLTPTELARREISSRLPDATLPVCFAPNVRTFTQFAEAVLEDSEESIEHLHPAGQRRLLRLLIDRLHSRGELRHFDRVVNSPGFLDLVVSFIAELKRDEIWPEQFTSACENIGNHARHTDLAAIYDAYQSTLVAHGLYDNEGRIWSARDVLAKSPPPAFRDFDLIVVDGFSDFTRTQLEILAILKDQCRAMIISLPGESPLMRGDLFAKSNLAQRALRETLGNVAVRHIEPGDSRRPALRQIARQLFTNPRAIQPATVSDGVEILAVTGTTNEAELIAARVKLLLQSGVDPGEIIVAMRDLDDAAALFVSRFRAAGVPVWCAASRDLIAAPAIRALLEVLRMEAEGWPFERVRSVLRSNYFRPAWFGDDLPARIGRLLAMLRRDKLHENRRVMLRVVGRRAERPDNSADALPALELLKQLSDVTKPLRSRTTFARWVERLLELGRMLGIGPDGDNNDSPDWTRFRDALFNARIAEERVGEADADLSLGEFTSLAGEVLQSQSIPPGQFSPGCVRVLGIEEVRNLDVSHLFLAGLTERAFPRMRRDDCLYSERERRELHAGGLPLQHNDLRLQEELLLFYNIATRAQASLALSFSEAGSQGDPQFPSPYVAAVKRLFAEESLAIQHVGELDPVPKAGRLFTPADARRYATVELCERRPRLFATLIGNDELSPGMRHVLFAIDANAARFETHGWTEFDGATSRGAQLRQRFSPHYQFSVTQLENYAGCRFRFLLSDVLGIEPLESPSVATDHRLRGTLMHNALAAVHRAFAGEPSTDIGAAKLTEAIRAEVASQLARRIHDTELAKALADVEARLLEEWSTAFEGHWDDYVHSFGDDWQTPPGAAFVELPFGQVPDAEFDEERHPPVTFGGEQDPVLVRGRIDRIDVGTRDGVSAFTVIDYKSGKPPRFSIEDVQSGRALQLTVYALAVVKLGLFDESRPFQMGYWSLKEDGFVPGIKHRGKSPPPLDTANLETLETALDRVLPALAAGIRDGFFPVDSEDPRCIERCPYNTVCRVTQLRRRAEALGKVRPTLVEASDSPA